MKTVLHAQKQAHLSVHGAESRFSQSTTTKQTTANWCAKTVGKITASNANIIRQTSDCERSDMGKIFDFLIVGGTTVAFVILCIAYVVGAI